MTLNEFTAATYEDKDFSIRPLLVCKDGFNMSVQGHSGSYSIPRQSSNTYVAMEIGFPSQEEPLIAEFAENKSDLTDTVYGYVDCRIIQEVIDKHGGIDEELTFKISR